jgi:expansin (peptidoglycan-binding protein)
MGFVGLVASLSVGFVACDGSRNYDTGNEGGAGGASSGSDSGSTSGGMTSGGSTGSGASACANAATFTGDGTYYDATGDGSCSFGPSSDKPLLIGAMNTPDYANSSVCGTCAHIKGPNGEVTVRIVDQCPGCVHGDIDLSPDAFEKLAPLPDGRIAISWQFVPCDVSGPIVYHFKEGSNQWWSAVQIRNHRHAIAKFEWQSSDGVWHDVPRVDYNYFIDDKGMGPGPYTFRVTDVEGGVVEDSGIPFMEAGDVPGKTQFAACAP